MPNTTETVKIPNPLYAAAGAGDIAMERLRKLPAKMAVLQEELPGRVTVLQDKITQKVAELPSLVAELRQRVVDADTDKLRATARRNAQVVKVNAQAAQQKASAIYADLVARGEQVIGRGTPTTRTGDRIVAQVVPAGNTDVVTTTDAEVLDATIVDTDTDTDTNTNTATATATDKAVKSPRAPRKPRA